MRAKRSMSRRTVGELQNPSTTLGPGAAARNDVDDEVEEDEDEDEEINWDDTGWMARNNDSTANATMVGTVDDEDETFLHAL